MAAEYTSKHGFVSRGQCDLYMQFVDMRNFVSMLPEDKKNSVKADFDTMEVSVQNFNIGIRVIRRQPYSLITIGDNGAPFHFTVNIHFDPVSDPRRTDFWLEVSADLNLMMKAMLGSRIREALDKIVDGLVAVSEGRMPEGVDPSQFANGFKF